MKYYKEIFLIEAIIFLVFWLTYEYLALLLTFIFVPIFFMILLVSFIAEKIESSKISKEYFYLMFGLTFIPILIFIMFYLINGGTNFDAFEK
jgi:hypothetical protein